MVFIASISRVLFRMSILSAYALYFLTQSCVFYEPYHTDSQVGMNCVTQTLRTTKKPAENKTQKLTKRMNKRFVHASIEPLTVWIGLSQSSGFVHPANNRHFAKGLQGSLADNRTERGPPSS